MPQQKGKNRRPNGRRNETCSPSRVQARCGHTFHFAGPAAVAPGGTTSAVLSFFFFVCLHCGCLAEAESRTRRNGVTWPSQPEGRAHTPLTGKAAPMLFFLRGVWSTRVSPWRRLLGSQKHKRRVRTNQRTNGERWLPASGVQVAIGGRSLYWLAGPFAHVFLGDGFRVEKHPDPSR